MIMCAISTIMVKVIWRYNNDQIHTLMYIQNQNLKC